jgi:hypothetical protein
MKRFSSMACLAAALLVTSGLALAQGPNKFDFAVIGDAPYGPTAETPSGRVQVYPAPPYERLIADINSTVLAEQKVHLVVHVGDIKEGNSRCDDNVYTENRNYLNTFQMPAIFVPGDNEWTDCHRSTNGSFDPLLRLAFLRSTFYPTNQTLGITKLTVTRQAGYPENSRWRYGPVLFVTLNMPGSNNGYQNANSAAGVPNPYLAAMDAEYGARNAANITWLNNAFNVAAADSTIKGVFVAIQANPFERFLEGGQGYTISGYESFISTLRSRTVSLDRPVILAHGDTHYYRIDRPMTGAYPACTGAVAGTPTSPCTAVAVPASPTDRIDNFLRLEVFAQNDVHWVKVSVNQSDPDLFSLSPQRVPGN